jgi:hypothetical protein
MALILILSYFLFCTSSKEVQPCTDVDLHNLTAIGVLIERCQTTSLTPGECQALTFALGESGTTNFIVSCGTTYAFTYIWQYIENQSLDHSCPYYNLTYLLNGVAIHNLIDCYFALIKTSPFSIGQAISCGDHTEHMCQAYITIGSSHQIRPHGWLLLFLALSIYFFVQRFST